MRAVVVHAHGVPPEVRDREEPTASEGRTLVRVTAAPIVPLDLLCATGTSYFGPPDVPYVPGVQGVGSTGDGRRVWFTTTAGHAPGDGSMADVAAVEDGRLLDLPDGVPDPVVAALGLSSVAAVGVLRRGDLVAGDHVAVLGATGVVGQVAVQMARVLGAARVVAVVRPGSAARVAHLGADAVVEVGDGDVTEATARIADASEGRLDLVVDPVCGVPGSAAFAALTTGGRQVNLGDSAGPSLLVESAAIRSRWVDLRGYSNLSLSWDEQCRALLSVLDEVTADRIVVDHDVLPIEQAPDAWHAQVRGGVKRTVLLPQSRAAVSARWL